MAIKPYTGLLDERRGQWTDVKFEPDRLTFIPSRPKTHWLAKFLTILVLVFLTLGFVQSWVGIAFLLGIVALIVSHNLGRTRRNAIVIETQPTIESNSTNYHFHDVRRFIIRENKHRDSDDSHLLQIYLELKGVERLVLLYQDYFTDDRNQKTRQIFDRMIQWLKNAK